MDAQAQQPVGEEPLFCTNSLYPETEQASYNSIITHKFLFVNRFSKFLRGIFVKLSRIANDSTALSQKTTAFVLTNAKMCATIIINYKGYDEEAGKRKAPESARLVQAHSRAFSTVSLPSRLGEPCAGACAASSPVRVCRVKAVGCFAVRKVRPLGRI